MNIRTATPAVMKFTHKETGEELNIDVGNDGYIDGLEDLETI